MKEMKFLINNRFLLYSYSQNFPKDIEGTYKVIWTEVYDLDKKIKYVAKEREEGISITLKEIKDLEEVKFLVKKAEKVNINDKCYTIGSLIIRFLKDKVYFMIPK